MTDRILEIINNIRISKNITVLDRLDENSNLRTDLGLTSFDLAELTVRLEEEYNIDIFEDGVVFTIGEILKKLNA